MAGYCYSGYKAIADLHKAGFSRLMAYNSLLGFGPRAFVGFSRIRTHLGRPSGPLLQSLSSVTGVLKTSDFRWCSPQHA